ncbi:MAG: hypothetical protein IPO28_15335 [Holophagaceae bacterium]|nr:hypothetical protein [Holophagaceae bacterium]
MTRRLLILLALITLPASLFFVRRSQRRALVPQPRGFVLGLYAGVPDYDYAEELDRIAATGATCVSLQAIYRMDTGQSVEIRRHPTSSPTEAALRRTFHQAEERGLRMMFFPTINMRDEAENAEWWRGNIAPPTGTSGGGTTRPSSCAWPPWRRRAAWSGIASAPRWPPRISSRTSGGASPPTCGRSSRASWSTA